MTKLLKSKSLRRAFVDSLPILAGYLFLGSGFGILLTEQGFPVWMATLMAITMYAGSGQYLGVELLASGAGLGSTALLTLLINARHFFYGLAMLIKYRDTGKAKPFLAFALTDETFSLVCRENATDGVNAKHYYCFVSVLNHLYWIVGCTLGAVVGSALTLNFAGVEFVMTALFVVIFIDQWRSVSPKKSPKKTGFSNLVAKAAALLKAHFSAVIGVVVTTVCLLIFGRDHFIIPAMIGILAGLLLVKFFADKRGRGV